MNTRFTLRCCQSKIKIIFIVILFFSLSFSRTFAPHFFISTFSHFIRIHFHVICLESVIQFATNNIYRWAHEHRASDRFFSCSKSINLKYNNSMALIYGKKSGHKKFSFLFTHVIDNQQFEILHSSSSLAWTLLGVMMSFCFAWKTSH